jgi:4-hydroxyphenylpyruvate dioxygenase-like putative hemolysin
MFNFMEFDKVDHMAVAVLDLSKSIDFYVCCMGFKLDCIRETTGKYSGMRSAVLFSGKFSIVLLQSLDKESQVQRYIERYGPGVQHVAFAVINLDEVVKNLQNRGIKFSTNIIESKGLRQIFTKRDEGSGMMYEFIERINNDNFSEDNVNSLFQQLEESNEY